MWFGLQSLPWQTIAIVPGDAGISTLPVAQAIVAMGAEHGENLGLADLRDIQRARVTAVLEIAEWSNSLGRRVVLALSSVAENLATISLARGADSAILCVSLGSTSLSSIEETVDQIGKERFLGSVLVGKDMVGLDAPWVMAGPKRLPRRT
jgi:hypothetical protein